MRVSEEGLKPSAIVLAPLVKMAGTEKLFDENFPFFFVRIMEFFGCMSQMYHFATFVALFKWEKQTVVTVCFPCRSAAICDFSDYCYASQGKTILPLWA